MLLFSEHKSHEFNESLHTLRLCWASGVNALISHRNHGKHRICKSLRPCWPPDEDNQRLYESAGLFVVSVRLVVEKKTAALYDDDNDNDDENLN